MASQYTDPRDFAQHIRSELLTEYLKKRHSLDFPVGKKGETKEECADRLMVYMSNQNEQVRDRVFMEFEYINSLSSENHIAALCNHSPDIDREGVIEKRAQNNDERAFLAYLNYSDDFDEYYSRANIESSAVKELTLPSTIPLAGITDMKVSDFEPKVQDVYRSAYKGEQCKIKVFRDDDSIILRAYLEDLPTRDTAFDDKGKLDEKRVRKPVFDAIFIYKPHLNMLGVRAIGGKDVVSKLQKLFCSHFLGIKNIDTNAERYTLAPAKDLSKLNLVADVSYGVERTYLKSIRLKHRGVPHKLFIDVGGKERHSNADAVQEILKELGLNTSNGWEVESIKITVVFKQADKGRRKQVQVSITPPNTCDLKNRPQDDIVRKLLKDWGIYVA